MSDTPTLERVAALVTASGGRLAAVESAAPAGFMAPLHSHEADEAVHVLEGRMTVFAADETVDLAAGETYVVPRGVAHTYRADGAGARAVFTTFTRSVARYESFLRAVGPAAADGRWATEEDEAVVTALGAAAEVTIHGAPGTLPAAAETARRA